MSSFMQILCRVIFSGLAKGLALMLLAVVVQAAPNAISPHCSRPRNRYCWRLLRPNCRPWLRGN